MIRSEEVLPVPSGFVYCIVHHERQAVKIGFSRNPSRRFRQLQTGSADSLTLFEKMPGDRALEKAFHKIFADKRLTGEWFKDSDHEIQSVFGQMAFDARSAA